MDDPTTPPAAGAEPLPAFGETLLRMRLLAGLTQAELAGRSGVSERTIARMERSQTRIPQRATLDLLAEALGLDAAGRDAFHAAARGAGWPGLRERRSGARPGSPLPNRPRTELGRVLLGRSGELAALHGLLGPGAPVTVCGVGGIGKSRLALAAAERARRRAPVLVVPLESLPGPQDVLPAIAVAAGLPPQAAADPARLGAALPPGGLLLLDDADRHHAAAPDLARLAAASACAVLVTSREPLGIPGERLLRLGPLPVPDLVADPPPSAGRLLENPAVALFRERAEQAGREIDPAEAEAVARVVAALDGMPLAIELAAAQAHWMPLGEMLALLESSGPSLLAVSDRPEAGRRRTMDDAIAWTADLLPEEARALLPVLGAFQGGFTREALADVLARIGSPDLLAALPRLLRSGLVHHAAGDRYAMLEPIRFHAAGLLAADSRGEAVRLAHARRFARFAVETGDRLHTPRMDRAFADEAAERANLVAAARWAAAHGHPELTARIVAGLWEIWESGGRFDLMRQLAEPAARDAAAIPDPELRRMARLVAAFATATLEGEPMARRWAGAVAAGEPDDPVSAALAVLVRDWAGFERGDPRLLADLERASADLATAGHPLAAYAEAGAASELTRHRAPEEGAARLSDLAERLDRRGDRLTRAAVLMMLAGVLLEQGRSAEARDTLLRMLAEPNAATGLWLHLLLSTLGAALVQDEDPALARRGALVMGAVDAWHERAGVNKTGYLARHRAAAFAAGEATLGHDAFAALFAEGRGLTLARAAAVARG